MTWLTFVDQYLMCELDGNYLTSAAILGQNGLVWAKSPNLPEVKPEELEALRKYFVEDGPLSTAGLFFGGTKYMDVVKDDPGAKGKAGAVIQGTKGTGGITIKMTITALVIAIYDEPVTADDCNMVVERLGGYLKDEGY